MKQKRDDALRCRQGGQEAVELALLFPILLMMIMGIVEFGVIFSAWISVTNGAREGARLAAVRGNATQIETQVRQATVGLDQTRLTVASTNVFGAGGDPGEQVTVTVTYNSPLLTPLVAAVVPGGTVPLVSQAVMRLE